MLNNRSNPSNADNAIYDFSQSLFKPIYLILQQIGVEKIKRLKLFCYISGYGLLLHNL